MQPVLLHAVPDRVAGDPEALGRARDVPVGLAQGILEGGPLPGWRVADASRSAPPEPVASASAVAGARARGAPQAHGAGGELGQGQHGGGDAGRLGEEGGPLDDVAQLADVAGPRIALQSRSGVGREGVRRQGRSPERRAAM